MIEAVIDGKSVSRAAVQAWEDRRTAKARKVLGLPRSSAARDVQLAELLDRKLQLGHDGIRKRISGGLRFSGWITRLLARLSRGKRVFSVCEIAVSQGSAAHFAKWFEDRNNLNDERAMIAACPDHYIIARDEKGRQLVVETTGGSPFPGEFTVDYEDVSSLITPPDPSFPLQVAGVARYADGSAIGGVRHQFRQEGDGFRARLTVEFPSLVLGKMVSEHRWHLATEFSNWIEAAEAARAS